VSSRLETGVSGLMRAHAYALRTPVAFLIFNRPGTTEKVFEAIRAARPPKLLVVADGPRPDRPGEAERCEAARAVIDRVDWPCDVLRNFAPANLGCRKRVSSGLDWVFANVEEAIVLEDDCLPHPSFFRFCGELLDAYRRDERVAMISGDNFQFGRRRTSYSYYYSRYTHIWGWASWKRAWKHYDVNIPSWPEIRDGGWLRDWLEDGAAAERWTRIFEGVHRGEIDTWDYQLTLCNWTQGALSIIPNVNLVSNIGFHAGATHTMETSPFANVQREAIPFPLSHPPHRIRDARADAFTERTMYARGVSRWKTLRRKIRRSLKGR
jgi:hypothetical protein